MDEGKTKIGYEIPFTRTFYEYKEIEPADQIAQRIEAHEHVLMEKLHELLEGLVNKVGNVCHNDSLKDSGAEWIGLIPQEWGISKLVLYMR